MNRNDESFNLEKHQERVGDHLGVSRWIQVTQEMIDVFGQVTLDPDPMHIDKAWCVDHSPFKSTVAFGFLTTSLITTMFYDVVGFSPEKDASKNQFGLNYGFDKMRLVEPVPVDSRVRGRFDFMDVRHKNSGEVIQKIGVLVEIEYSEKPALVAEWLSVLVNERGYHRISGSYQDGKN